MPSTAYHFAHTSFKSITKDAEESPIVLVSEYYSQVDDAIARCRQMMDEYATVTHATRFFSLPPEDMKAQLIATKQYRLTLYSTPILRWHIHSITIQ